MMNEHAFALDNARDLVVGIWIGQPVALGVCHTVKHVVPESLQLALGERFCEDVRHLCFCCD